MPRAPLFPCSYNYDQALFASHVNLGLSDCGANLWVIVTDIDEYIYIPKPGRRWPEPLQACMQNNDPNITMHSLQRVEVLSSTIEPEQERGMWVTPGRLSGQAPDPSSAAYDLMPAYQNASFIHPLEKYDMVYHQPLSEMYGKAVVQSAAHAVLFFVHEAVPLYGRSQLVQQSCMALLHVVNFHGRRKTPDGAVIKRFQHWLFAAPGSVNETLAAVAQDPVPIP
jgi:hypothetical protein